MPPIAPTFAPPVALPDRATCDAARLARDVRFDGLFFTGVVSTGIYCRPVCPAVAPKPRHIVYYPSAAAAEAAGLRPCLRCRPELAPGSSAWRRGDGALARALTLVDGGYLAEHPLPQLAAEVHLGERQLRRLFCERVGAAPHRVHATRRLLFAKHLLSETALPITEVALAAGFASLRRFHAAFASAYGMPPTALRRRSDTAATGASPSGSSGAANANANADASASAITLRLAYRPPLAFDAWLAFLRARALPGVEVVGAGSYRRSTGSGWFELRQAAPGRSELCLTLHGTASRHLLATVQRVRRMADLDADPAPIDAALAAHPRLAALVAATPGLRIPGGWSGFELAVRAVVGQQVSVAAARTLLGRLVARFGTPLALPTALGLTHAFPSAQALAAADVGALAAVGLTSARAATLRGMAQAVQAGAVSTEPGQSLDAFVASWTALPGIGPWTAQYLALRALGHPDAFPAGDLVLQRAAPGDGTRLREAHLAQWAQPLRPWRGYAALHLWRSTI